MPLIPTIPLPDECRPGFYWARTGGDKYWNLIVQILDPSDPYYSMRTYRVIWIENELIGNHKEWRTDLILGPPIDHPKDTFTTYDHALGRYV
jgi:hypothetical protein